MEVEEEGVVTELVEPSSDYGHPNGDVPTEEDRLKQSVVEEGNKTEAEVDELKSEPPKGDNEKEEDIDLEGKPEDALPEVEEEGAEKMIVEAPEAEAHAQEEGKKVPDAAAIKDLTDPLQRPPNGSEVFVGGLPRDVVEDDLRELFAPIGDVYEIRIMEDKETGQNKGFGFVTFSSKEDAEKAIQSLSDAEVKGKKVRVSHTQPKNRLFIGNVPKQWEKEDLEKALKSEGPGITTIELLKDPKAPTRNRGFAFVEYYNHACAENVRRSLTHPGFRLGGNMTTVSWADPRPEADASTMANVKVVYVKGLPESATEENLSQLFCHHGEITKVLLPAAKPGAPRRDFGFVHFAERSQALKAIEKDEKYELDGSVLEVSLARPLPDKRPLYNEHHAPPSHRRGEDRGHYGSRGGSHGYEREESYGGGRHGGGGYSSRGVGGGSFDRGGSSNATPIIYGRGPMPAGMTMVPMLLPDGRIGYVFQPSGGGGGGGSSGGGGQYRDGGRQGSRSGGSGYHNSGSQGRRYRPY